MESKPKTPRKTRTQVIEAKADAAEIERAFAHAFIANGGNRVAAYRACGLSKEGDQNERRNAARMYLRPSVQAIINEMRQEHDITPKRVLGQLAEMLAFDVDMILNEEGKPDIETARALGVTHLISEIQYDLYGNIKKFVTMDRQKALEMAVKLLGLEQQPRSNEHDRKRTTELIERHISEIMTTKGLSHDEARRYYKENILAQVPEAASWVM